MARRLNTRFLTILLLVIVGLAGGVFLAEKLRREHPDRYIELGTQAIKDHKWQDALTDLSKAAKLDPHNPQTPMLLAQAWAGVAEADPEATGRQIAAYRQALEIDPNYLPALRALSDFYSKQSTQQPAMTNYDNAIEYTKRAHKVAPDDEKLQSLADRLVIERWANGLSEDQKQFGGDEQKAFDAAVADLKDLWKKHPGDADLPMAIAGSEIAKAAAMTSEDPTLARAKEVTDHYKNAVTTFESVLTGPGGGTQAKNASMHFGFARTLERLAVVDQGGADVAAKYHARASSEMDLARGLAKPADADYVEINEFAAGLAMQRGDHAGAVAIYKKMPQTPLTQLSLADILSRSPDTRSESVAVLKNLQASLTDDPNHLALGGIRFLTMMELAKVETYQYVVMPAGPEKEKAHSEIRAMLDKLNQSAGVRTIPALADIEARLEMGSGPEEQMAEVQKLSKLMANSPPPRQDYYWYSLQTLLAEGYESTNQSSNALAIMKEVVAQYPHDVDALKHLITLLLIEQPDQARERILTLEKLSPKDPALPIFRIEELMSDPVKNHDRIEAFYKDLKETNIPMMIAKARVAMRIKEYDEAIRLLTAATTQEPKLVDEWVMLSRLEFMLDKKDAALATANKGLAANPGDPQLQVLIPKIKGEDAQVIQDLEKKIASEDKDKTEGEIQLSILAAQHGDLDQQQAHLETALRNSPDSARVQDMLFNFYTSQKKYTQAANLIPMLAREDADRAGGELYRLSLAEAQNDSATAEAIARRLTQDKPEFARSWLALGDVLRAEGHFDQAIPEYNNCLQKESSLSDAYIGLAKCYYGMHRNDDALHTIEDGLKRLPSDETLSQMKMAHEINFGQPDQAILDIRQQLQVHREPKLYAALADAILRYCDVLRRNKQPDDATKQAQQGVDALQDPLAEWPDESEIYLALSECQIAANHPQDALTTLQKWADRPSWKFKPEPYLAMSELYGRFGKNDLAEDEMNTAMKRSGYRVDLQIRMASLLALDKKTDDALTLLRSTNADKPEVREKVIQILLVAGRFDEAQTELKSDLAGNPPDAEMLQSTWALALYERGQYAEAADRATEALKLNPNDPTALFCRARSYLKEVPPDPHKAQQDLATVREASPNNVDVRLCLADAYLMMNQPEQAISELQAGVRLLPTNKELRMRLVGLFVNGPHPRLTEALKLLQDVDNIPPFDKDPDVFQNESVILSRLGNNSDALAKIETARQINPSSVPIQRTEMQLLLDLQNYQAVLDRYNALDDKLKSASWAIADAALAEKRLNNPQALDDYKRALVAAKNEDQPVELDSIARSMVKEFSYDDAVSALLPIAKDYVSARITLARIYQGHGDDPQALATMDLIMTGFDNLNKRDKVNVLTNAALLYQLAKPEPMTDKAYDAYRRWLELEPTNIEALNNMACLLADSYNPPRAAEGLKYANEAVNEMMGLGRTEPRLLDTQAWLMILNGQAENGVDILNRAMDNFDPFPDEYLHLGEGYLREETPQPVQAETQAKLGLQIVEKRNAGEADAAIRAKLQDLINRSEEMRHSKQQAPVQ